MRFAKLTTVAGVLATAAGRPSYSVYDKQYLESSQEDGSPVPTPKTTTTPHHGPTPRPYSYPGRANGGAAPGAAILDEDPNRIWCAEGYTCRRVTREEDEILFAPHAAAWPPWNQPSLPHQELNRRDSGAALNETGNALNESAVIGDIALRLMHFCANNPECWEEFLKENKSQKSGDKVVTGGGDLYTMSYPNPLRPGYTGFWTHLCDWLPYSPRTLPCAKFKSKRNVEVDQRSTTPIAPNSAVCTYVDGSGPEPGSHDWKSTYDLQIGEPFNMGGGCNPILGTLNSIQFPNLDGSENEFHGVGNYICEDDGFGNTHLAFDTEVLGYDLLYRMIVKLQVAYPAVPFEEDAICCPLCLPGALPDWTQYQ